MRYATIPLGFAALIICYCGMPSPAVAAVEPAKITDPADKTTLVTGTQNFKWDSGIGASQYALWVGSSLGGYDLYASAEAGQERTVNLPVDGRPLYVRLWSLISGAWQYNEYTYTAYTAPEPVTAKITNPENGTTLTSGSVTFEWDTGTGVNQYALWVGSSFGGCDLYAACETNKSRTLVLPVDGRPLYVRLWSFIKSTWETNDYAYTSYTAPAAQILTPSPNTTLTDTSTTFTWTSGTGASQYALWVGSSPGSYDLYAGVESSQSRTLNLPANSRTLYVRLWSLISGVWHANSYIYTAATPVKAAMLSPAPGSTNNSTSVTFTWSTGTGVSQYALWAGTAAGNFNLGAVATGTNLSWRLTLPATGSNIYVRLWSLINGNWLSTDYTYTAASPLKASMTSPAGGSTFGSASATFTWNAGVGVDQYALWVGSASGSFDLGAFFVGTNLSRTVTIPTDNRALFVRLWSLINGTWQSTDYSYTSYNGPNARMTFPALGAILTGPSTTLTWSAGTGATQYALWVGSSQGTYDLYAAVETSLSRTLNLPVDGRPLYVRLWTWINGDLQYNDYNYTAYTASAARLTSPTAGATLTRASTTFTWSAGTGVTQYALWVGSSPASYDLYAAGESGLSRTMNVPLDGRPLYVTVWSLIGGVWHANSYTCTAPTPTATETWSGTYDAGFGTARFTFTKTASGTVTADGEWRYGLTVCPFTYGTGTITGTSIAFTATGTAYNTDGSGSSAFTLTVNGTANHGAASGTYSVAFTTPGWGQRGSPNWIATRTSGSGITP